MRKHRYAQFAAIWILGTLLVGCSNQFSQNFNQVTSEFLHLHNGTSKSNATMSPVEAKSNPVSAVAGSSISNHNDTSNSIAGNNTINGGTAAPKANMNTAKPNFNPAKIQVVSNPESILVLVNKYNALPDNYVPPDLVTPNIPFLYQGNPEIHLMRKVAADALVQLVAGAKKDGIYIYGVSAYRSYATQQTVYDQYVATQGVQAANTFSAKPGTSEHQTGLAIDVSDSTGQYAVEDGFAKLPAAKWLAQHAYEYGFVIRYPKNKESITGYQYEPWHIRYVGKDVAKLLQKNGWTLEEYYQHLYK
ncbi:M15 family metallopeptidase [Fodinisporobacter ferrooxydans]|uniref:M15 family metallopeptidase n=1 Tax=Fodinisporobacter ferrooxydans TaxID=2901836 RepID=A0ABY4CIJ3_9BACL|nr:M15 family metallopeptidase [Alicyclobacillaceae bacterium MYW30-H2]